MRGLGHECITCMSYHMYDNLLGYSTNSTFVVYYCTPIEVLRKTSALLWWYIQAAQDCMSDELYISPPHRFLFSEFSAV